VAVCIYQFPIFTPNKNKHVVSAQTCNCPHNKKANQIKMGLPIDELFKITVDAIWVTKHVQIDYLRTDLFCIYQDDEEYFERHTQLMSDVWLNAIITHEIMGLSRQLYGFFSQDSRVSHTRACGVITTGAKVSPTRAISPYSFHVASAEWR